MIALEEKSLVSGTPWKTVDRGGSSELIESKALYDDTAQEITPPSPSVKNPLEVDDAVQGITPPSPSVQIPLAVGEMNLYVRDETNIVRVCT